MNAYDISYADKGGNGKGSKRRNSLTPPREDKEQDDYLIQHSQRVNELQIAPLTFTDDNMSNVSGNDDSLMYNDKIIIVDDDEMIINGDKVNEIPLYGGNNSKLLTGGHNVETNNGNNADNDG